MRFASRLDRVQASLTMKVMQEALDLRAAGADIIDLGPGEPDFPSPARVKEAGIDAIRGDFTKYTPSAGIKELRQAVAEKYNRAWGSEFSSENVLVTCGAKHAIFNACMTAFEEGDEVLLPVPYWVTFPEVLKIAGAEAVEVPTDQSNGFVLDPAAVVARVTPRTAGLIVNTPNNPTGAVVPADCIGELVDLARSRGLLLLFDETYDYFTYSRAHTSLARFAGASEPFYAIVGSFSKTYSMTGWRLGYCLAEPDFVRKMNSLQSHQTGNPSSISQKAALAAVESGEEIVEAMKEEYAHRRREILRMLSEIPGFVCAPPEGAFYVFPNVSRCMERLGIATSEEFAHFLLKKALVATVPGEAFGIGGYIRISYAASRTDLAEGIRRIKVAVS